MDGKAERPLLVPSNPGNVFNDPYNVGLFGGAIVGLLGGYLFAGKLYPTLRRVLSSTFTGPTKLALVVNAELGMSKGKIASQCSHASLMAYKSLTSPWKSYKNGLGLLTAWEMAGEPKIVLRAENLEAIEKLARAAKKQKIQVKMVLDAGKTEVPSGSVTVLAVGPAPTAVMDDITSHLRLL
ncbi:Peptidyl-tRNA hydrolase PTH2 [Trinorchestia longiramus]|nr:Peptidyl-tRNA hydrolase PTH2 [Trinorchestia longiramus]